MDPALKEKTDLVLKDVFEGRMNDFVLELADELAMGENGEKAIVEGRNIILPGCQIIRTALAVINGDRPAPDALASLAELKDDDALPDELVLMIHLMLMYDGMLTERIDQVIESLDVITGILSLNLPEELENLVQFLQLIFDIATIADAKNLPDTASLAYAIAIQFFPDDVRLQVRIYRRIIQRSERTGSYDASVRLFFRYILPIRQNWVVKQNTDQQVKPKQPELALAIA